MAKYLSDNGVLYLLQKLKSIFVQKEAGKGLFSGNYADLAGRPTKLSDFVNDAGFQTASQVQAAIASAGHLTRQIVSALPNAEDADEHTIYMIEDGAGNNRYQ